MAAEVLVRPPKVLLSEKAAGKVVGISAFMGQIRILTGHSTVPVRPYIKSLAEVRAGGMAGTGAGPATRTGTTLPPILVLVVGAVMLVRRVIEGVTGAQAWR